MVNSSFTRFILMVLIICSSAFSFASNKIHPPMEYLHSKIESNDIVFLGTTHRRPEILSFMADMIPTLRELKVSHIGLEISSDQQTKIDFFMKTGGGLDEIQLHRQIDCPEYRHLFKVLRKSGGPIPIAIDLPYSMHSGDVSRDQYMSQSLSALFQAAPQAKVLVIVGNLHILKKLEWLDYIPHQRQSIRQYLQKKYPSIKIWSVGQVPEKVDYECDFAKRFGPIPGAVALDLDERYRGLKLGFTDLISITLAECFELVDGLIVY